MNLAQSLAGKASASHTHSTSDISGLGSASVNYANSAGSVAWGNVSGKPSTYAPSGHTHDDRYYTESEMNSKLAGKLNTSGGSVAGNITLNSGSKFMWNNGSMLMSNGGQHVYIMAADANYAVHLGVHDGMWTFDPDVSGNVTLGTSNHRFGNIFSVNSSITNSDRNLKNSITNLSELNKYMALFSKIRPVSFKFNDGTSDRTHIGFISQDVEAAMAEVGLTSLEFAGFCKDQKTIPVRKLHTITGDDGVSHEVEYTEDVPVEGEYIYSLRYEEFIALNTMAIQSCFAEIQNLAKRIELLEA